MPQPVMLKKLKLNSSMKTYTDAKNWHIGKDPDAGKDWRHEEKGMIKDEKVGWHHWLDGHEFEQTPGNGEGRKSLGCRSPWGCKELDMTEGLSNPNLACSAPLVPTQHSWAGKKAEVSSAETWSSCTHPPPFFCPFKFTLKRILDTQQSRKEDWPCLSP